MNTTKTSIFWFRRDLRLADNPALTKAVAASESVLPIYLLDDATSRNHDGAAARWWTHHSLASLNKSLAGKLNFYKGDPDAIIIDIALRHKAHAVFWNRCYEPHIAERDARIIKKLQQSGVDVVACNGSLLVEAQDMLKDDGAPYKVFTPFYRRLFAVLQSPVNGARQTLAPPNPINAILDPQSLPLVAMDLLPKINWHQKFNHHWDVSEGGGQQMLADFLRNGLSGYKEGRNFPSKNNVSRLSPYLHSGEISPHQVWHAAREHGNFTGNNADVEHFCSELGWREFSYYLLHYFPELPHKNWQAKFDDFPWCEDADALERWQKGLTGYPFVDAGMRELWQTGYMHNRVRMVVASFLIKNLLIDWRHGADWFWDCLVDADLANNSASWQWVAGSGADAAPYFRIFNPVTQGEKFDPAGEYTRKYIPELARLPDRYLFRPWDAPQDVLEHAGVTLGQNYPYPIVDLSASRGRALAALAGLKKTD